MKLIEVPLPEVKLIEPSVFGDNRGFFYEAHNVAKYRELGLDLSFVQDNVSRSAAGVLRGVHYQWPKPQGKLVRVVKGTVFDVAVDIRRSSPTFGSWVGEVLSAENKRQLWIPEGFAHGFIVLSDVAECLYKATDYYAPQHERCIIWDDPKIGIEWPFEGAPVLSGKDRQGVTFDRAECFE